MTELDVDGEVVSRDRFVLFLCQMHQYCQFSSGPHLILDLCLHDNEIDDNMDCVQGGAASDAESRLSDVDGRRNDTLVHSFDTDGNFDVIPSGLDVLHGNRVVPNWKKMWRLC